MFCKKCKKEIPEESKFCNQCGAKQIREKSTKRWGNGNGTVYKGSNGKWIAEVTIGWDKEEGSLNRRKRRKTGFSTKNEAIAYLPMLRAELPQQDLNVKFKDLYKKWMALHSEKVSKSTINCYKSAYKYFTTLYYVEINKIRTDHLQKCVDECPHGIRTKENMKALCTSLWDYAVQLDIVDRNYAKFIYIPKKEKKERLGFTNEQLDLMWQNLETVPDLKYVLLLCYTGMRITELKEALTENYHKEDGYFVTGIKTEAGKNRVITISPKIRPFFEDFGKGKYLFTTKSVNDFRDLVYYPALQAIGLDPIKEDGTHINTPHICRHTFATLMKQVEAPPTDKQKLIGHSKFEMTAHYTHTDLESLSRITDQL
jgi:integrase